MKKRGLKLLAVLLALMLLVTTLTPLALRAMAATNGDSGSLRWALNDEGVFTVNGVGYGAEYSTSLTNAPPWRSLRSSIKKVIVEEGVQSVGDYWFYNCTKLESVELPDSLVKLGAGCFQSCSSLQNITMPENCCEYYNNLFYGCSQLKWAVLSRDNTVSAHTIPSSMFYGCSSLENVWVGSGYTTIASNAFRNCSKLKSIIWTGDTISSISNTNYPGAAIVGNSSLSSWCSSNGKTFYSISGSCSDHLQYDYDMQTMTLTLTGNGAMTSCPWNQWRYFVRSLDLGTPSTIGNSAFSGCEYLTDELAIPSSVTAIGASAFSGAGFEDYVFYSPTVQIDESAFDTAASLTFYGKRGSGVYAYVTDTRTDSDKWRYYCLGSHVFGNNGQCSWCDKQQGAMTIAPNDNHEYVYQYRIGNRLYYRCKECGAVDVSVKARELILNFSDAVSATAQPYQQTNYDGRFDILRNGYVNANDYKLLKDIVGGKETPYDMTLTNENATKEARALYRYIADMYGEKIIAGQQESTWEGGDDYEVNYIYQKTGKYPAIRGFDFMGDDFNGVVRRAKTWANRGGIVTICWHCSSAFDQSYDACKADEFTEAQWEAVLTDGTPENQAFIAGMDKAANALRTLQNEGIPVLWRPFHEFDGAWFWWGKGGSEYFKRLWIMMYDHYTNDLGLNNLIWVLGYCHNGTDYGTNLADWYPGNQYCDIVGADSYEVSQNGAEARLYNPIYKIVGGAKPMAMHETGLIPTEAQFATVPWVYFMTWHTTWLTEDNTAANLNTLYNSDYVIALDELPDLY